MADLRVPDLNHVVIAGRLTRDPDLKYTASNRAYVRFGLANTRYYKTKHGEKREDTTFVNATAWDKQAEWIGERLKKGRPVLLEGSLRSYESDDRDAGKTTRLEVNTQRLTPLDWDEDKRQDAPQEKARPKPQPKQRQEYDLPQDDDIPF